MNQKLSIKTSFLIIRILVIPANPFSIQYVDSVFSDEIDYRPAIALFSAGNPSADCNTTETQTYRKNLQQGLRWLDSAACAYPTLKSEMLKGVFWSRLSELKVGSAFEKADAIFRQLSLRYPEKIEGSWFRAINLMEKGRGLQGIHLLDSLVQTFKSSEPLCYDFARHALQMLFPICEKASLGINPLAQNAASSVVVNDSIKPNAPSFAGFSIISESTGKSLPKFFYSWSYRLSKQWSPDKCPPGSVYVVKNSNEFLPKFISGEMLNQLLYDETESRLQIVLDFSPSACSLQDFLVAGVGGLYDSLSFRDEFAKEGGLSVKCFRTKTHKNEYGGYAWYISFDRYYYGGKIFNKEPSQNQFAAKIRCLMVLTSCLNDWQKAETQFNNFIKAVILS